MRTGAWQELFDFLAVRAEAHRRLRRRHVPFDGTYCSPQFSGDLCAVVRNTVLSPCFNFERVVMKYSMVVA